MKEGIDMFELPYEKMICDSDLGDGGIRFYKEYAEWLGRRNGIGFKIYYKDITGVVIISGRKKKVIVQTTGGNKNLYLYKAETLKQLLYEAVNRVSTGDNKEAPEETNTKVEQIAQNEDIISALERLAKLHESGSLTDEEFAKAKEKILS